ncbi:serine hydrolase [Jannaschia sp. M317]|nr:serine hydrolase [Jannaschia sp. M317]
MNRALRALTPFVVILILLASATMTVRAAPYAEMVMDARTGEVLRSRNADTRLHPASLTKMMTLYIAFEAVRRGEITLDTQVRISRNAANEPPSKLGLRAGQKIALRYLIRAAAVKSANDAATAIGEAISGSESAFAERMTMTARALGMTSTTFRNAHGLTQSGHMSTARDMTVMGRRLFYDYPQYYNLFSRRTTDAGVTRVRNTNRRLLDAYPGADGIKTGFTNAAGFNLVASAERGGERVIATVFGGRSTATRNARIAELLDLGFQRAPSRVAERKPALPTYGGATLPGPTAPAVSMRPVARGGSGQITLMANASGPAVLPSPTPAPRPDVAPAPREVVTRASTSGGRSYAISLSNQPSRSAADKLLLRTALQELDALDDALRQVERVRGGYEPSFVGLSEREANRACTRLRARDVECSVLTGS